MKANRLRHVAIAVSGLLIGSALTALAPPAWGVAPTNDNRADAIVVTPPGTVSGTLVDATLEVANDSSNCADTDASVWYRFTAPTRGAIVVQLDAAGDLDASMDLFKQVRSELQFAGCANTDAFGVATIDHDALEPRAQYALRVGRRFGSVADAFTLRVLIPTPPAEPPGVRLPPRGVRDRVDRLLNPDDAYHTRMRAGRTMRLSLRTNHCTSLKVFGPGTQSFSDVALKTLDCGGYGMFTPAETGRYFLVVTARRSRERQPYWLRTAPTRRDDTVPGVFIKNHKTVKGRVNGGIDTRDLYRFDVVDRSALILRLSGQPRMRLVRDDGAFFGSGDVINRVVRAGRYYVAIEGSGAYILKRLSRTITHASLYFNGHRRATIAPTASARLSLRVRPRATGPSRILVERFDPIDGWHFLHIYRPRVKAGVAALRFTPPSRGWYRAFGVFRGSRSAAPDETNMAQLRVQGRLVDKTVTSTHTE